MFSFWELDTFLAPQDVVIAGGGFAGLWSAYYLKKNNPALKILILEKNSIPTGASSRNAGFACFGSVTELMEDTRIIGKDNMLQLVKMRFDGLKRIAKKFATIDIDFKRYGGYELITARQYSSTRQLKDDIAWLNKCLYRITNQENTFRLADKKINRFSLQHTDHLIENKLEGQLHPGKLMQALLCEVQSMGVVIKTGIELKSYEKNGGQFTISTGSAPTITTSRLLVCTNAFADELLSGANIIPARGQVLVTSPIENLAIKGTFHYDEGFYYFRNLGKRILLGGARNTAFQQERTTDLAVSENIQLELERFLREVVLPHQTYTIDYRWSGIMGMGSNKFPIIKEIQPNCFCLVGLGGMGVALAPFAGEQAAKMMT